MNDGWTVEPYMYEYVQKLVPTPATVLELGSGISTKTWASLGYKVISIEHDEAFIPKESIPNVTFIHAPIELYDAKYRQPQSLTKRIGEQKGWYNREAIKAGLSGLSYDLIVVDGPTADYGRSGFLTNLGLFPTLDVPIVFDDMHRIHDLYLAFRMAQALKRDLLITNTGETRTVQKPNGDWKADVHKPFGVILCNQSTLNSTTPTQSLMG